ncbi:hypothetical protein DLJ53_25620 [Acuticoccus sediminis]|uniref:Uncharacterized protein n=1 Tax=Acuticoccus sediminis TaxID=2184697 RepID=A0A8B2NPZ1_9HYPH|nr:hypothetical protein [Acuticoccus sediminis]RAH99008.1 hypothetical protein DLJ53_25620 [Acuticoccus sediminis]
MPIRFLNAMALCEGDCGADEAEPLRAWLARRRTSLVDLAGADHVHTAVVQVILAARPIISSEPKDPFLCEVLGPVLETSRSAARHPPLKFTPKQAAA